MVQLKYLDNLHKALSSTRDRKVEMSCGEIDTGVDRAETGEVQNGRSVRFGR